MKGITPVVAVILLLLVTIGIVGFAFGFFQRVLGTTATSVEDQTSALGQRTAQTINIINVLATTATATGSVTVRNTGTANIATGTEISVFGGGALVTCSGWSAATLKAGETATCTLPVGKCNAGTTLKITAPGNEDSRTC